MKMHIVGCLSELIKKNFGQEKWQEILELSGMGTGADYMRYVTGMEVMDEAVMRIVQNTCKVLRLTLEQAADAFGDYWVNVYAPKIFPQYYRKLKDAKHFIMQMDELHKEVTKDYRNARPPRFDIEDLGNNRIKVHYKSGRKMIDFYIGLAKGVGKYFNTKMEIKKLSEEFVEIQFFNKD
jgi:hypothetical protein